MSCIAANFRKQPSEKLEYTVQYSDWLVTGQTLSSAVISVAREAPDTSPGTLVVSGPFITDTTTLTYLLDAGEDGDDYKITILTTMSNGEVKETDISLAIEEI